MRTRTNEINEAYSDLGEIKPTGRCLACGSKERKLVRIIAGEDGKEIRTRNAMYACENPKCWRYTDISRISPAWQPAGQK